MYSDIAYRGYAAPGRTATLFGQAMGLVALTAGFFAAGAYAGRNLSQGAVIVSWIAAFVVLMIMNFAARRSAGAATVLLVIFGVLMGVASAPTLVWYATTDPAILWQAGGATALFVGAFGAFGYLTQRDLSAWRRMSFIGLIVLLLAGIVLIFVHIPHASLIWAVLGLVVFAGLTAADFQRLRRSQGLDSAPLIAASIFLDILNVFWFFLRIFSGSRD
ncbi:MAG TPA: Bax inhibitor-1 family protein [Trebonia sp.]